MLLIECCQHSNDFPHRLWLSSMCVYMHVYIYIYIYIHSCIHICVYMTNFKKSSHSNGNFWFASVPLPFRFRFASVMRVMSTSLSKDSKVLWKYSLESFRWPSVLLPFCFRYPRKTNKMAGIPMAWIGILSEDLCCFRFASVLLPLCG